MHELMLPPLMAHIKERQETDHAYDTLICEHMTWVSHCFSQQTQRHAFLIVCSVWCSPEPTQHQEFLPHLLAVVISSAWLFLELNMASGFLT